MSKANELDGYTLQSKLRKARASFPLSATAQALFYELAAIYNDCKLEVFQHSNQALCNSLLISENTLSVARQLLVNANLIYYLSGKSKREFSKYSFLKPIATTSNFDTNTDAVKQTTSNFDTEADTNTDTKAEDYNKEESKIEIINNYKKWSEARFLLEIEKFKDQYSNDILIAFFEYWKERTPRGLMRFQTNQTWETGLRLKTWYQNSLRFSKNSKNRLNTTNGINVTNGGKSYVCDKP